MARKSKVERRIQAILSPNRRRNPAIIAATGDGRLMGYVELSDTGNDPDSSFIHRELGEIRLNPAASIDFQVIENDHSPVEGADVMLQRAWTIVSRGKSDRQGRVRLRYPVGMSLQCVGAVKSQAGWVLPVCCPG